MPVPRIEFTEYYPDEISEEEIEYYKNLKIAPPAPNYHYRRVYLKLNDIDFPREIEGDKEHSELVFNNGDWMAVLGSYDCIALLIEDRERMYYQRAKAAEEEE